MKNMRLIADSGSTKTEWCLVNTQGKLGKSLFTSGLNPYFLTEEEIKDIIAKELLPQFEGLESSPSAIYFYGAGCAYQEKNAVVARALKSFWNIPITVYSDILAAAHALCGNYAGIPCILGTGSNSCLYNGKQIIEQIAPLGFILGDEGSGAALGRALVSNCLKRQLSESICRRFLEEYNLTSELIMENVYRKLFPNRFLASLTPFLKEYIWEDSIYKMIYNNFQNFFQRNVMLYTHYEHYPVHFVGSIAYHFQDVLRDAMHSLSLEAGKIEQSPMRGLIEYYQNEN